METNRDTCGKNSFKNIHHCSKNQSSLLQLAPPLSSMNNFSCFQEKNNNQSIPYQKQQQQQQRQTMLHLGVPNTGSLFKNVHDRASNDGGFMAFNDVSRKKNNPHPRFERVSWQSQGEISFARGLISPHVRLTPNIIEPTSDVQINKDKNCFPLPFIRGQWSSEEDRRLSALVNKYGEGKWAKISQKMCTRAGKQCRERWQNHLRPYIKKDAWSEEEELMLIEAHRELKNRWAAIARRINGRTENSVKNHWNATRRKLDSRKKRSDGINHLSTNTLLEDYIESYYYAHKSTADPPPPDVIIEGGAANSTTDVSDEEGCGSSSLRSTAASNFSPDLCLCLAESRSKVMRRDDDEGERLMLRDGSLLAQESNLMNVDLKMMSDHHYQAAAAADAESSSGGNDEMDVMEMISSPQETIYDD